MKIRREIFLRNAAECGTIAVLRRCVPPERTRIRSGIEAVITGLTRNQFGRNPTWVRIPPAAPRRSKVRSTHNPHPSGWGFLFAPLRFAMRSGILFQPEGQQQIQPDGLAVQIGLCQGGDLLQPVEQRCPVNNQRLSGFWNTALVEQKTF